MGQCFSVTENARNHKEIQKYLRGEKKRFDSEIKLLLLGAGESGKSTIAKQMRIIHLSGFDEHEKTQYKGIINNNVIVAMRILIRAVRELSLSLAPENVESAKRVDDLGEAYYNGNLTKQLTDDIRNLWKDPAVVSAFARAGEYHLGDSTSYYFNALDRISADNFAPTEQDILRARAKTTGIVDIHFTIEDVSFHMVDVGGQRSERRKWINCFQEVTAVIFCVALSEYDLKMFEDDTTPRMAESMTLFSQTCNSEWFRDTAMILFLNKQDLFQEKIKNVPLTVCFPDYKGPAKDYDASVQFITDKFIALNQNTRKPVYPHVTCATSTQSISVVFSAVKDIVLRKALDNAGIV